MIIPDMGFGGVCDALCLLNLLQPIADEDIPWVGLQVHDQDFESILSYIEQHL